MLKSCSYCGRIHDTKDICAEKRIALDKRKKRRRTKAYGFHRSYTWTNKSIEIRERDNNLCLCCKAMLKGTIRQFNSEELSVHHIIPIEEDYDMRLEESNLITVCRRHHEMCEDGTISRSMQQELVDASMQAVGHSEDAPLIM